MRVPTLADLEPSEAADLVVEAHRDQPGWLDAFADALDRRRGGRELAHTLRVWGLSLSEGGRAFGVSRQALTKWTEHGVPADRAAEVADLVRSTDLLVHHLKRDRIAAVVRRPADALGGQCLLDLLLAGRTGELLDATRRMFDFGLVHR